MWTVDQKLWLVNDEREINLKVANTIEQLPNVKPKSELSIKLYLSNYCQRKQSEKLSKIKGDITYGYLSIVKFSNRQDVISNILSNYNGCRNKQLGLNWSSTFIPLSKKLIYDITFALCRSSEDTKICLSLLKLTHKKFWRIFLSMRHVKNISIYFLKLHYFGSIGKAIHVDWFNCTKFMLISWEILNYDATPDKKNSVLSIINTFATLKKIKSTSNDPLELNLHFQDIIKKEVTDYIEYKNLSDIIKVTF